MKEKLWNGNYLKAWSANFMLYFSFMILTQLLPLYLSETYGADKDTIGAVLSGYALTALIIRPFSGYLVDSFPRKMVLLVCYGLFFVLFGGYIIAGSLLAFFVVRTLHGAPMGATTVANSTVAIDALPSSRRNEGIGYYGLSNNLATAIAPTIGLAIYSLIGNYDIIFALAFIMSGIGFLINTSINTTEPNPPANINNGLTSSKRVVITEIANGDGVIDSSTILEGSGEGPGLGKGLLSGFAAKFFLLRGWSQSVSMTCFAFSYGVVSTYLAIYGKEQLGITAGTGIFFALLSCGLMLSRLIGARSLRQGKVAENASHGIIISVFGYLLFAGVHNPVGYYGAAIIIGLGNGHMFPAFQTMYINLAPSEKRGTANSTLLTAWELGMGLGIIIGGVVAEVMNYDAAFWVAWAVNTMGAIFFFWHGKEYFLRHKLR